MIATKKYFTGVALFLFTFLLFSCTPDEFDMSRLARADDINPYISAPLAYGTFKIEDFNPGTLVATTPIPAGGLSLDSVMLNKTGLEFKSSAIDSVFLVTHFTNNTAVDIEYTISFIDRVSGTKLGSGSTPEKVLAGATDQKIIFKLNLADQNNLKNATDIRLDFRLLGPATGTINYGNVRLKTVSIKLSFYAPVNLWKLTN